MGTRRNIYVLFVLSFYLLFNTFIFILIICFDVIHVDQSKVAPPRTSAHHFSLLQVPVLRLQSQTETKVWIPLPHTMPRNGCQ